MGRITGSILTAGRVHRLADRYLALAPLNVQGPGFLDLLHWPAATCPGSLRAPTLSQLFALLLIQVVDQIHPAFWKRIVQDCVIPRMECAPEEFDDRSAYLRHGRSSHGKSVHW